MNNCNYHEDGICHGCGQCNPRGYEPDEYDEYSDLFCPECLLPLDECECDIGEVV